MRLQPVNYAAMLARARTQDEFKESEHPRAENGEFGSGGGGASPKSESGSTLGKFMENLDKPKLDIESMTKVGGQLGSNEGGIYKNVLGDEKDFYIKKGQSQSHVNNEYSAAALYNLAGANTLKYRHVEGQGHIATEWQKPTKKNVSEFTPEERKKAQEDFVVHAWLANWDAVGTGGDNQAIIDGKPTSVDLGGALEYRAQGGAKGDSFGSVVNEWDTMRNGYNDASALFGSMTKEQLVDAASKVIDLEDSEIEDVVGPGPLANKLIARKNDLIKKVNALSEGSKAAGEAPTSHPLIKAQTKGNSEERVALRKLLKETKDKSLQKAIQSKIMDSFKAHHASVKNKNPTKAAEIASKAADYAKKFGVSNPLTPTTVAQANEGYSPKVVEASKMMLKSISAAPTPAAMADANDLNVLSKISSMGGGDSQHAKTWMKHAQQQMSHYKLPIDVGEAAHIVAYSAHGYRAVNKQLRSGAQDEHTWQHTQRLNKALGKLPAHVGKVYRKTDLSPTQFALYQPGKIVTERGFTSSSTDSGTWSGEHHYVIQSKTGRDIRKLSMNNHEDEILFRSDTQFRVTKVEGKKIYMEEVDGRG